MAPGEVGVVAPGEVGVVAGSAGQVRVGVGVGVGVMKALMIRQVMSAPGGTTRVVPVSVPPSHDHAPGAYPAGPDSLSS